VRLKEIHLVEERMKCPVCGQGQMVELTRLEEFDVEFGGETLKVRADNVPIKQCDKCGEVLIGPAAARAEHEAVC
jgi:YgiT-type zinc finger domain-containing protein